MITFPLICKECKTKILYTNKELFEEWNFGSKNKPFPKSIFATKSHYLNCPNCGEPTYVDYVSYSSIEELKKAIRDTGKFADRPELDLEDHVAQE